jgi:predicted GIY-YIG superfamily endonuclease
MHTYWVYIMANLGNTVLYTGVTSNLRRRVAAHKNGRGSKFTSRYNVTKLVFCESFGRVHDAIAAEKTIKAGSRARKMKLIEIANPEWQDLYEQTLP